MIVYALRARIKSYELLSKLFVFSIIVIRVMYRVLLILPYLLQRTLFVLALAHVYHSVVGCLRYGLGVDG